MTGLSEAQAAVARIQSRIGAISARFEPVGGASASFARHLDAGVSLRDAVDASGGDAPARVSGTVGPQAAVWQDMVDGVAKRHDLEPDLIRAVVMAESGGNPKAQSPAGALGLMQLMPETARALGVKRPLDAASNLEGGARYLSGLVGRFGLAEGLAAYNAGPGAVQRYGGVPPYPETQGYVNRVMSLYQQARDAKTEE